MDSTKKLLSKGEMEAAVAVVFEVADLGVVRRGGSGNRSNESACCCTAKPGEPGCSSCLRMRSRIVRAGLQHAYEEAVFCCTTDVHVRRRVFLNQCGAEWQLLRSRIVRVFCQNTLHRKRRAKP